MMSPKSTSALSPSEMKCEKPTLWERAQSSTAVHSAPDCETKAIGPGVAAAWLKLALRPMPGLSRPTQFGPRIRNV